MKRGAALAAGSTLLATGLTVRLLQRRPPANPLPGNVRLFDDEVIHYVDQGSGPAIVFIHGLGGSTFSWRHAIERFAATHRVIALDLPGFGYSERDPSAPLGLDDHARRVARVMETLGVERATVAGHSMGAAIAQRLALLAPERMNGLVLVAPMGANDQPRWQEAYGRIRLVRRSAPLWERSPALARSVVRRALQQMAGDPGSISAEMVEGYARGLARRGTGACLEQLARCAQREARAEPANITAPTLVLAGDMDPVFSTQYAGRIAGAIPGAEFAVVESCGHMVPEEQPGEFHRLLEAFLAHHAEADS
ncbi:MAG: alpha/beta fold hydrolase [Dehalococcoidia bacterium]|nr:alpha/beta fold hydrolase [Dehalococcoidia bacterium]